MNRNIVPEPSLTAAERTLVVVTTLQAAAVFMSAMIAVHCGLNGLPWMCALNAACAGFNLGSVLTRWTA